VLESVHIEASVAYTDDCYAFDFELRSANGVALNVEGLMTQGPYLNGMEHDDLEPLSVWTDEDDATWHAVVYAEPKPRYDTEAYAEREAEARRLLAEHHAALGGVYEAALDAAQTIRALSDRLGDRFFLDAFGIRAAVTVRRDVIEITDDVVAEDALSSGDGLLTWDWEEHYVGPLRGGYLTSEAHGGIVGLRENLRVQVRRAEHTLIGARMRDALGRLWDHKPLGWTTTGTGSYAAIESLLVGGVTVARDGAGDWIDDGPSGAAARMRAVAALRASHGNRLADAAGVWFGALLDVVERYGRTALLTMPPLTWEDVTVHRFGHTG
jgi:hypothetical protein